jgi:hypothetical protein
MIRPRIESRDHVKTLFGKRQGFLDIPSLQIETVGCLWTDQRDCSGPAVHSK